MTLHEIDAPAAVRGTNPAKEIVAPSASDAVKAARDVMLSSSLQFPRRMSVAAHDRCGQQQQH